MNNINFIGYYANDIGIYKLQSTMVILKINNLQNKN